MGKKTRGAEVISPLLSESGNISPLLSESGNISPLLSESGIISPLLSESEFRAAALETFHFQMKACAPYRQYVELLGVHVREFEDIPFLPIELFKTHRIYAAHGATESDQANGEPEALFTSSGTTGAETSRHYVASLEMYERSFRAGFEQFYGDPAGYSIFALLPSYLERSGSSLVYMVEHLQAQNPEKGGFYLYDFDRLADELQAAKSRSEKILLIGVTFALLDFAHKHHVDLSGAIVMETGGMKGRGQEVERSQLHQTLCQAFNVPTIHSEYGMTEMLSQCYSFGGGIFHAPNWVRISARSLQNPLQRAENMGGINVIDLANRYSCSFLATGDRGGVYTDGRFEIHGRIVGEQLRGCNMLIE